MATPQQPKRNPKGTPAKHNLPIGTRLEISSEELVKFMAIKPDTGEVTIREDGEIRMKF